jgi:L-phenylalanine/L-methionine N-acetyltransferase
MMKIRPIEVKDAEKLVEIMRQRTVLPNIIALPSLRIGKFEERLKNPSPNQHDFVAEIDGKVVGLCGLNQGGGRRAHTGSLFVFIDEEYHGRGIGTSLIQNAIDLADNWLMIERIELTVIDVNTKAKALYEKLGFNNEGFKHGSIVQNGRFAGEYCMARFRPGGAVKKEYDKVKESAFYYKGQ